MTNSIVARLIAKDLAFNRAFIIGGTLAGLATILLTGVSQLVGMITYVTVVVVLGVFLGIVGITRERAEGSALFVLSLPVSTLQYTASKVIGALISFLMPWTVLLFTVLAFAWTGSMPSDGVPFFVSLMMLLLTNFVVLVTVGVITTSERWVASAIILTNVSVPLFFSRSSPDDMPVGWAPGMVVGFAIEAAIVVLCLGLVFYTQSRRRDFV